MKPTLIIKMDAGNDRNGNPRVCYVGLNKDCVITNVWQELYAGFECVPATYRRKAQMATRFKITVAEYNTLIKW